MWDIMVGDSDPTIGLAAYEIRELRMHLNDANKLLKKDYDRAVRLTQRVRELEEMISGLWGKRIEPLEAENSQLSIKLAWAVKKMDRMEDAMNKARNVGAGHGDVAKVMCDVLRVGLVGEE
jgi:chromosome segregation ATPase